MMRPTLRIWLLTCGLLVLTVGVGHAQLSRNGSPVGSSIQSAQQSPTVSVITWHDSLVSNVLSLVRADSLRAIVRHLESFGTRFAFAPNRDSVYRWIRDRFMSVGFTDVVVDSFLCTYPWHGVSMTTWQKNVIATLPGRVTPSKVIIIGAHYDSRGKNGDSMVSAPGADDNGSGTAAVLEIARITKLSGFEPQSTVKFVAFAAEELGYLGSLDYAQKARAFQMNVRLMIALDVVSYSRLDIRQSRVGVFFGDPSICDVPRVKVTLKQFSGLSPVYYNSAASDDWSFMHAGFPSVGFLEDTFSPYLHSPQDVDSTCNYDYCAEVTRAACALALTFADVEISFIPQSVIPPAYRLFDNYPNPFNGTTNILFDLPAVETVSLKVFDSLGREIAGLIDGKLDPGMYSVQWIGKDCASGVYFFRMQSGKFVQTKKMLKLK